MNVQMTNTLLESPREEYRELELKLRVADSFAGLSFVVGFENGDSACRCEVSDES